MLSANSSESPSAGRFGLHLPAKLARGLKRIPRFVGSAVRNALFLARLAWRTYRQGRRLHLIALVEHFGDIVACEPVIRRLRQRDSTDLVWIARSEYGDLVRFHPDLHAWLGVTCLTEWMLLKSLFWFLPRTDLHIDGRVCSWFGLRIRNPNPSPVTMDNYYDHGNLLRVLSLSAGLEGIDEAPFFHFGETTPVEHDLAALDGPYAVFHCRANQEDRNWPASGFERLARFLVQETPLSVIEVGLAPVLPIGQPRVHSFCGRYRLDQYGYLIGRSSLFVGVDSGFAHVANAVGVFGVILLGHYRQYEHYMPYSGRYGRGENCLLLRHSGPVRDLDVDDVIRAVRSIVPTVLATDPTRSL